MITEDQVLEARRIIKKWCIQNWVTDSCINLETRKLCPFSIIRKNKFSNDNKIYYGFKTGFGGRIGRNLPAEWDD